MSDPELVERARQGDTAAFGLLVDRHRGPVYRAALAALASPADAEEVAQDAFVAAFRRLDGFRGDASFRTWVVAIAWRKALTRRRSVRMWMKRVAAPPDDTGWKFEDPGRSQERALMDANLRRHVARLVRRLSPKLRDALLLAASGEHTMDEIGRLMGVPSGTVKWRVSEARRQLKGQLAQLGYGKSIPD